MKVLLSLFVAVVYVIVGIVFKEDNSMFSIFIGGLTTFLVFYFLVTLFVKKLRANLCNQLANIKEKILAHDFVNYQLRLFSVGGIGYLLKDRFVFMPHQFNFSRKTIVIAYSQINKISENKKMGLRTMKFHLKSGENMMFIINNDSFSKNIQQELAYSLGR